MGIGSGIAYPSTNVFRPIAGYGEGLTMQLIPREQRLQIANEVIRRLGARRAKEAMGVCKPPIPSPYGFDGVDKVRKSSKGFRARIRYCDALAGRSTLVCLGTNHPTTHEAGLAYMMAHILLWGGVSRYAQDISTEELEVLIRRGR